MSATKQSPLTYRGAFLTHANAILNPNGRLKLALLVVDKKWALAGAADRFSVSFTTAKRWADRYRANRDRDLDLSVAGMVDRSSRPTRRPRQLP